MSSIILKYNLKTRGLDFEKENPLKAIDYYLKLRNHEYFVNDYYPYRRLVMMYEKTGDDKKRDETIKAFFKSGIYCNSYNRLWFLSKLDSNYSPESDMFKNRTLANYPLPIADRIRKKGKVTVEPVEDYEKRQKHYEYELKANILFKQRKYREYVDMVNFMIDNISPKQDYFKRLCMGYRKLRDREGEIKAVERYFTEARNTRKADLWFENRLNELENTVSFNISEYDLTRNPFFEYMKKLPEKENLKRKAVMIEYGKTLPLKDAIDYYKYLCNNTYFSNDYYPYRQLSMIYDEIKDYGKSLINIKKLLQNGIYLNEYQLLYFTDQIRQLISECDADESIVEKWLEDYEMKGSLNRFNENKYPGDRFINNNGTITVQSREEFEHGQKKLALVKKGEIYESVGNLELAVIHYVKIIDDEEFNYLYFHEKLCECLDNLKDYEREKKAIRKYSRQPPHDRSDESDKYFKTLSDKLDHVKQHIP